LNLAELTPLEGGREYFLEHWIAEADRDLMNSDWENREAFSGSKYNDYSGYARATKPKSIFEVGVAAGYSIGTMIWAAEKSVTNITIVDIHPDIYKTVEKLKTYFPEVDIMFHCFDSFVHYAKVEKKEFDIVHIDADHRYEYALADLNHFGPWVSQNGLIVVDDANDPNVLQACNLFKDRNNMDSRFISNHNGHFLCARKQ
jgi:predicted O-methyltransferase YrrM